MAKLIASMKINVLYNEDTPIIIRRFPTEFEINILSKSPFALIDEERKIADNEIIIKIFKKHYNSVSKLISGGIFEFNEVIPPSIYIDIKTKHADADLNRHISNIIRLLCKDHLKPGTIFPSRYTTSCRISECTINNQIIELFLQDFCKELKTLIKNGSIKEELAEVDYNEITNCQYCSKEIPYLESVIHYNALKDVEEIFCQSCFDSINKNIENGMKNELTNLNQNNKGLFDRIKQYFTTE